MMKPLVPSPVVKRTIKINGRNTSVSIESPFWVHLKAIAASQRKTLEKLVSHIDRTRDHANLSSAVRLFVLNFKETGSNGKI